jgi:hypothetical protein
VERLRDALAGELARLRPVGTLAAVLDVWREVAGPAVAAHAWPARLSRDGTLVVHTSSSTWAFELSQLSETVRERLQAALGTSAPRRLRFVPGPLPSPSPPSPPRQGEPPPEPSEEVWAQARSLVSQVGNAELARRMARAAALALARGRAGRPV